MLLKRTGISYLRKKENLSMYVMKDIAHRGCVNSPEYPSPQAFSVRSFLDSTMSCDVPGILAENAVLSPTLSRFLADKRDRIGTFRAEKRTEYAWTFLPRSPGRVWENGGISNIFLPKIKMFLLITWKEQAICLQMLQAVVITLSLLNFLEEYLIVKRTLTTLISLLCTGNLHA